VLVQRGAVPERIRKDWWTRKARYSDCSRRPQKTKGEQVRCGPPCRGANRVQPTNSKGGNWWQSPFCRRPQKTKGEQVRRSAVPRGKPGYSQPIPKAGIGGSPRFAGDPKKRRGAGPMRPAPLWDIERESAYLAFGSTTMLPPVLFFFSAFSFFLASAFWTQSSAILICCSYSSLVSVRSARSRTRRFS
jgi:hypothetical protein